MAYDAAKDEVIETLGNIMPNPEATTYLMVKVRRYDGGDAKVAIERLSTKNDALRKLGRLTLMEAKELGDLLTHLVPGAYASVDEDDNG